MKFTTSVSSLAGKLLSNTADVSAPVRRAILAVDGALKLLVSGRQLAFVTDPEGHRDLRNKVRHGLLLLCVLIVHHETRQHLAAALAAAPPATLDALGEWITQPGPSEAEVDPKTMSFAVTVAAWAAGRNSAAAAALARRRSVVRALVSAVGRLNSPDNRHDAAVGLPPVVRGAFVMFYAIVSENSEDVMLALAAGRPGSGRDSDDLVQRLRSLVEAAVAGGGLTAADLEVAEGVLAALTEGEERLKTRVHQQQQQQQQQHSGGTRACAGCGKTAADEGVDKLRRCNGCPRESALWFCSVACQKAVWVGGHKRECPRLDTAAQRDGQRQQRR